MTDAIHYLMRDAGPNDLGFIVRGWVKEMRHAPWARYVKNWVFHPAQHELVHRILGPSQVTIACDRENPELLLGCIVHQRPVLHWLYVKGAYRGLGIGRALVFSVFGGKPERIVATQASKLFDDGDLVERYGIVYSPYLLLGIGLPSAAHEAAPAEHSAG